MEKIKQRPSWEEIWMNIAEIIAQRSVCLRYQVGAVLVRNKKIVTLGYNGPPKGITHCGEIGCAKQTGANGGLCRGAHAEMNAIVNAANHGLSVAGTTLFCTYRPCLECSKHLINAEVAKIIFKKDYEKEKEAKEILKTAGIELLKFDLLLKAQRKG